MISPTAILADPIYKEHWTGEGHPERPQRFDAVLHALERAGAIKDALRIPARPATEDELALCHGRKYIDIARRDVAHGPGALSTGDTEIGPRSFEVALKAVGGILNAVDAVVARKAKNAFCVVRPPGHHATPNRGMGFCLFNNVAIAARYARKKHGIDRAVIVDWDVHHGNGTQDIFWHDPTVMYCSTHQMPLFPGTGASGERGEHDTIVNAPLASEDGSAKFRAAFENLILPQLQKFSPELIIVSAGFDAHYRDPLASLNLKADDFGWVTRKLMDQADASAGGRVVSVLEGGYDLQGLKESVAAHVTALMGA